LLAPFEPYYLACILLGLMEGMEIQWLEDPDSFDLRTAMRMLMQLSGLLAADKRELMVKE
jgi:hypothetical protein